MWVGIILRILLIVGTGYSGWRFFRRWKTPAMSDTKKDRFWWAVAGLNAVIAAFAILASFA